MSFLGRGGLQGGHAAGDVTVSGRRVVLLKHIAEGGFGFISVVQDSASHRTLVLKRSIAQSREAANMARTEVELLKRLHHPNIIRCEGSETKMYGAAGIEALLLLEYCPGGHLLDYLNSLQGRSLLEREVLDIHRQVTSAVEYLHAQNPPIVHRDLKLENVLRAGSVLKLCDFGSCVIGQVPLSNAVERANAEEAIEKSTTQMYRAPEMCDLYMQPVLTEKTDVWALGCMLYATCFLVHPFNNAGNLGIINARITFPSSSPYGENMHNLILHQLQQDPSSRVSASEVSQYIHQLTEGRSIPVPAAQPEPEPQRRKPPPKPARELKPASIQPKQLDPNSLAARRLAERKGGRRRSYTEADAVPASSASAQTYSTQSAAASAQEPVQQLAASFDAFGLSASSSQGAATTTFDAFGISVSVAGTSAPVASPAPGQGDPFFDPFALSSSLPSPQRQSSTTESAFDPFGISASSPTAAQDWSSVTSPRVERTSRVSLSSYVSVSERVSSPALPENTSALSHSPEDFHGFPMSPCARSPKREQADLFELFAAPASPAAAAAPGNSHSLTRQRSAPAPTSTGFDPFGVGNPFQQQPSPVAAQQVQQQHQAPPADMFAQQGFPGAAAAHFTASASYYQQGAPLQRSVSDGHWISPGAAAQHPHPPHPTFQQSFHHQPLPNQQLPQQRPGHMRHMTSPAAPGYGQLAGPFPLSPQAQTQFDQFFGSGVGSAHTTQPFSQPF